MAGLDLEYFLVGDYLWRHEKHINRESYILRGGRYPVILLVGISYTPCFFGKYRVSMVVGIVLCLLFFDGCLGMTVWLRS